MGKIHYKQVRDNNPHSAIVEENNRAKYEQVRLAPKQEDIIEAGSKIFDQFVTRNYLQVLSECEVRPLSVASSLSPMRWYKIDKIVKEKDVFFTDKLSMLYMALHKTAQNVVLMLNKQDGGDIELYLGARDFAGKSRRSGEVLQAGLDGYFPGIGFQEGSTPELNFKYPSISSVSAIASLRDDKKEKFVQGLERLINATISIPRFQAYFIAENINETATREMIGAFNNLHTRLSPAETLQLTYNESRSKGISESFSENFSKSIGESISKTITHTTGLSQTTTESLGSSENHSEHILKSIWHGIVGGGTSHSFSMNTSEAISKNFSDSIAEQKGSNVQHSEGTTNQKGKNDTTTTGISSQITYKNRTVKYYLDILDKQLERLQSGSPFGLWSVATYFVANDSTTVQQLSNIYRGSIIGEESGLETCAINSWNEESATKILPYLKNSIHPLFNCFSLDVSAGSIVTSQELAIHLSLPQSSVPGIIVEERASFSRNVFTNIHSSETIKLGNILHLGKEYQTPVNLDIKELTKHVFVTGSTGSGKSNAMYLLLKQLREIGKTFMVIEPAKGEYKHVFGCLDDVVVYSNTPKVGELLQINPFIFPYEKIDVLEHIDNLVEIFNACWPMYAAMPAVLKHSIITAYENCGWDIQKSKHKFTSPFFPKIEDVVESLKDYINKSDYSAETKGDYKGALEVRLNELCEGMFGMMLNSGSIDDELLFNRNVIVDLSRIKSAETKALIMGFLVMKLNEYRMAEGGMNLPLKHVTVLEEAHNLLKRTSTEQSQESSNLAGKSVEMISNSIAEMRTYGEAFVIVDQSPSALDDSAIRNTNTKIILALPAIDDRKAAGGAMTLSEEQVDEIGRQKQGEAIVYQNVWEDPVQCKISLFEEYEKDYVYTKTSNLPKQNSSQKTAEMIKFLLYPHVKQEFDLSKIKYEIDNSSLPTSLRFRMMELYNEYTEERTLSIWNKDEFFNLSQIVRKYLNMDAKYSLFTTQCVNMEQVRVLFDNHLRQTIGNVDRSILYWVEYIYVRNNAHYEEWRETFKKYQ